MSANRNDHSSDQLKQIKEQLKQFGCVSAGFILSDLENSEDECVLEILKLKPQKPMKQCQYCSKKFIYTYSLDL